MGYPQKDMGPVEVLWDGDGIPPEGHGTSGSIMGWRWYTPRRTWDQWKYYGMEMGYPHKDMGPVEVLWDGDGIPPGHGTSGSIMGWRWNTQAVKNLKYLGE